MTGLRGRVSIAGGALIIMAALAVSVATATGNAVVAAPRVQGTDVSNLTTVTSWPDVKAAGNTFVGIEAAQGATITNGQYQSQVTGATSAGLFVMPYVFADPAKVTGGSQFKKAWAVISAVPGVPYSRGGLMLPISLDMEIDPINFPTKPCYGLSQPAMVSWIQAFIAAAKAQTGVLPIIYTTPSWWKTCTNNTTTFSGELLWIAHYGVPSPAIPPGWTEYTFWQYSNSASVSGISGRGKADLDQMQGAPGAVYAKSGSSGSVQVHTLNALAGQAVTYGATGLRTGLSLNSSGLFSWTSATAVGSYPVTVTPSGSSAVIPSAVSFTFDVHGTVTVAFPGNRTTIAGAPVSLRIGASGPDQNAGFKPSFTASGLPAGLSINSSGLITGWPSKPGTFKVTVSASDGLHGTGSAAFTWTIKAAANTGYAGAIRQVGGSGRCLNDPGVNAANGTRVNLWSCNGHSNQRWTVVQDGTIRVLGKCLDVVGEGRSNGTKLQLWSCNSGDGGQLWRAGTDGELVNPQSGKCLDVPVARAANGTQPVLWSCANLTTQPNEHWNRPAASVFSGEPGKCLATSGSAVVLAGCANVASQHWTAGADGTFRLSGKCLTQTGITAGSGLSIGSCSGAAATKWKLAAAGPLATEIASAASGLCVTVPSSGTNLAIESCAATPQATWHVE